MKPRLLDLFCGAGGAAMGYHRAGFEVVGVDIKPQPHYPFEFHQADALTYPLDGFDAIHASPPCQAHTHVSNRWRGRDGAADHHPDLVPPTRRRLQGWGGPYVIENVVGASMPNRVVLHGGMFGLLVDRPRLFESNVLLMLPWAKRTKDPIAVYGAKANGRWVRHRPDGTYQYAARSDQETAEAMGIGWMSYPEMAQAIPPAYTEWIGRQLMAELSLRPGRPRDWA